MFALWTPYDLCEFGSINCSIFCHLFKTTFILWRHKLTNWVRNVFNVEHEFSLLHRKHKSFSNRYIMISGVCVISRPIFYEMYDFTSIRITFHFICNDYFDLWLYARGLTCDAGQRVFIFRKKKFTRDSFFTSLKKFLRYIRRSSLLRSRNEPM